MTMRRIAFVAALGLFALSPEFAVAGVTTTVVDIPLPRGAKQRILYVRPDNPFANMVVLPGGIDGVFAFTDDGVPTTQLSCTPFYRTRNDFAARGIAIALVDQTSDFQVRHYDDILEVARYMRARDGVPT